MAIPDIPTWVQEEMTKLDYQRREAFKVNLSDLSSFTFNVFTICTETLKLKIQIQDVGVR